MPASRTGPSGAVWLAARSTVPAIGVDETSFKRRHEYVTIVNDLQGKVLHVADGRSQESLDEFFARLGEDHCRQIEAVAMDMWQAYISSTTAYAPQARIIFDQFHIAKHLGDAVDRVRRSAQRELVRAGDRRLVGSKYLWLQNPLGMTSARWSSFAELRKSNLRVARAWGMKEAAMSLWGYIRRGWAERMWRRWCDWASRSRLAPMVKVGRMIRTHWEGVINAATSTMTNASAEGINSKIQWIKRKACGYRNRERYKNAIDFHLGGLDLYLYPGALQPAHTNS